MLFNAALFSTLLLVPAVLAVPSARGTSVGRLQSRYVEPNLAGAYFAPDNGIVDGVTATFTVPTTSGSIEASTVAAIALACNTDSTLYAGVVSTVASNGQSEYAAWLQLNSDVESPSGITSISAGDSIRVTVAVLSTTSANVTIENLTNNETAKKTLTSGTLPLCRQYGAWLVYDTAGRLFDFGTLTYTNALVSSNGTYYAPYGGNVDLVDMVQNGQTVATTSISSENITIKYNS